MKTDVLVLLQTGSQYRFSKTGSKTWRKLTDPITLRSENLVAPPIQTDRILFYDIPYYMYGTYIWVTFRKYFQHRSPRPQEHTLKKVERRLAIIWPAFMWSSVLRMTEGLCVFAAAAQYLLSLSSIVYLKLALDKANFHRSGNKRMKWRHCIKFWWGDSERKSERREATKWLSDEAPPFQGSWCFPWFSAVFCTLLPPFTYPISWLLTNTIVEDPDTNLFPNHRTWRQGRRLPSNENRRSWNTRQSHSNDCHMSPCSKLHWKAAFHKRIRNARHLYQKSLDRELRFSPHLVVCP